MVGKVGDAIVVESERVGESAREGEIVEVQVHDSGVQYRVRWANGHESLFRPGAGNARIIPRRPRRRTKTPA